MLKLLPASTLALALALLVPRLWLQAAWLARPTAVAACLPVVSSHERRVIPLSNKLSFVQCCGRTHLHPLSWCITQTSDVAVQRFVLSHGWALQQAAAKGSGIPKHTATLRARRQCIPSTMGMIRRLKSLPEPILHYFPGQRLQVPSLRLKPSGSVAFHQ